MKQLFRDYFTFNKRERNGVFILLSIILLLILYLLFADYFFPEEKYDFSKFEKEVADFELAQKQISDSFSAMNNHFTSSPAGVFSRRDSFEQTNTPEADSAERFFFNPNNLPQEDWMRLGLSEKQIKVIKNYESKGGKFRTKEDVKKMYCITPEFYASLEPYIQIPSGITRFEKKNETQAPLSLKRGTGDEAVELNSADTTELKKLKGIGSSFAKRIVKFRDMLGGFARKEQLLEVYGFDKEKFDLVSPYVKIDLSKVKTININSASVETLKKHPYMNKKAAASIFWHRVNKGDYSDVSEILTTNLVDEELYSKIAPYLKVE